ncbi:MAG TPA: bifunctional diaminohydroxyphosphoribosylaminopyrimidine deaminase/5-amino-6-(5-phosphoribosylamino)uracil reductase RibD [Silvibacterium sp.]|nr:bifunctional diaminohydroxyphosphoribosylaminopyrimidine deaminase/5-amino-6-(5-phosphoribosylamino)uracil reductase RibD [Silvibacterium sp.]
MNDQQAPEADTVWMARALELARKSIGVASPNPAVGCILVKDEKLIGEGFHIYDQFDHAEVAALKSAGHEAKGATAYVTLEPCSHTGRTGPCSNALIAAGIARVVIATADPNPAVNGCGIDRLRRAGIAVDVGVMQQEARDLNDGFARYIQTRLPFLTLKAGLSLDGRIAPAPETRAPGESVMLTSDESRAEVQRMRHASDAIITGINTVLADNPLLTDRSGLPRRRPLLRFVLDSTLRLPLNSRLVQTANDDLIVFCTTPTTERRRALEALHIRVEQIEPDSRSHRVSLQRVLERLGELEITAAMLEAGAQLNAAALPYADKLSLFFAPIMLGLKAVPLFDSDSPVHPIRSTLRQSGPDFHAEIWLRDPWAPVELT